MFDMSFGDLCCKFGDFAQSVGSLTSDKISMGTISPEKRRCPK